MGKISFSSATTRERYRRCRRYTAARGDESLLDCMQRLRRWTNPIIIGSDFDEMSFSFREQAPGGGICGGIIYHGPRDGYGDGSGPTFSVCLTPTEGYSIHT